MVKKLKKENNRFLLFGLLLLTSLVLLVFICVYKNKVSQSVTANKRQAILQKNLANNEKYFFYNATVSKAPTFKPLYDSILSFYLDENLFNISESKLIFDLKSKIDPRIDENKYNYSFYLKTKTKLNYGMYTDANLRVSLTPLDPALQNFVANNKYCIVDSDCSIRSSFCDYGAYNNFEQFYEVFGCGPMTSFIDSRYPEVQQKVNKCVNADNGFLDIKFSGASCVNNLCTGLNPIVVCELSDTGTRLQLLGP